MKTLLRPFIFLGLVCVLLIYANIEWILPRALLRVKKIEESHRNQKNKDKEKAIAQRRILEDGSILIFQQRDPMHSHFTDVYWIKNIDEIYRMKSLYVLEGTPIGEYVDHFIRSSSGELIRQASFNYFLPEINLHADKMWETAIVAEELPLSELHSQLIETPEGNMSEKQAHIQAMFYYKALVPWLSLLAVIGPAPFCVRYNRYLPIFLIYAGCLFLMVCAYLVLDAALILGSRQVVAPFWAMMTPFSLFFIIFGFRYWRKGI